MQTSSRNYKNYSYSNGQRLSVEPTKSRLPFRLIFAIAFIAITGGLIVKNVFAAENKSPDPTNKVAGASTKSEESEAEPEKPKKVVNTDGLSESLRLIMKKYPYDTSVSIVELNSGKLIQSGDAYPYVAASTTKLLTAMLYLNNVEIGQASLNDKLEGKSAESLLKSMIKDSDNEAWRVLNEHLTKESIEAYARKQGLASYEAQRNVVTSNDMANLLAKLYKNEVLNKKNTDYLLSLMQNTSEERFIPASVPKNTKLYHKAGYLPERVHDVAILDNGSTPFVLVIYSKAYSGNYNYESGQKLFKQITETVIQKFEQ